MPGARAHSPAQQGHADGAYHPSAASGQGRAGQVLLPDPGGKRTADLCLLCQRRGQGLADLCPVSGEQPAPDLQDPLRAHARQAAFQSQERSLIRRITSEGPLIRRIGPDAPAGRTGRPGYCRASLVPQGRPFACPERLS